MLLLWTHMIFFCEIHVFLHLSWIGLFGSKWAFLHLESCNLQEVFLSKLTQFWQGNNVLVDIAPYIDGFYREIYVFLQLCCIGLFGTKRAYFHLGKAMWEVAFIWKMNTILTGNNVLDPVASNIVPFLWKDTCVSSATQVNIPICST
jgi:hypothetical protein